MEVAKVLHMNGGIGDTSYAKNSLLQQKAILMTKPITDEAISALYHSLSPKTICIADLGCSTGPNTLLAVSELIKTIHDECKSNGQQSPAFHVFLNDLPSNDFNTIFRSLSAFHEDLRNQNMGGDGFGPPNCFVAGVAGSFYTRLFPFKSLHFVHSSYSLHWLSQVPDGTENNKGNIYLTSTSPVSVLKGYYMQYERDFATFLKYRSEELVKGGRMVLTMLGRKNQDNYSKGCSYEWELLATTLKLLVTQGSIEEEKVNSFNIPLYNPSPTEVKYIVEKEGSFTINCLETSEVQRNSSDDEKYNMARSFRSVAEPLLVSHFGDELNMDQLFHKYNEIIANDCMGKEKIMFVNLTILVMQI
ncbi:S-adenosyl-L-methionine:benzoic acid/salicylic acid carboxyl methyltransferase 2-like [Lycium barbarum]|uniref:S-adenosyl-L-methionine:benzoic acid/salicylic acid carboxyl methyltransferase 2-like n=1 Tax=Lycium barbarum TaxID=112863 RepID=UPI00293EF204|nr:S-adenosyl-L-methionine:benzoic acid/salicylic acid carboxyl methyltransferase 2-like [Lycium barbarum]